MSSPRKNHAVRDDYHIPKRQKLEDKNNSTYVTNHYNSLQSASRRDRKKSRILYMRNFNNWIKSTYINKYTTLVKERERQPVVLDLACGKGGDFLKWDKGRVRKVVCSDIAKTSVEDAKGRYEIMKKRNRGSLFDAEFSVCDASKEDLRDQFRDHHMQFNLTSCQFAIHYSFESEVQAERMIRNACQSLKEGGYFIGSTVNSQKLRERLDNTDVMSFGNTLYKVIFESKDDFPSYGCRYVFKLDDVVDCPEFVLDKEIFVRVCRKYGMKLLEWKTFEKVFWEHSRDRDSYRLIKKLNALEQFDTNMEKSTLNSSEAGDYSHAEAECARRERECPGCQPRVATLSKSEWAVSSLYVAFAFVKDSKHTAAGGDRNEEKSKSSSTSSGPEKIPLLIM